MTNSFFCPKYFHAIQTKHLHIQDFLVLFLIEIFQDYYYYRSTLKPELNPNTKRLARQEKPKSLRCLKTVDAPSCQRTLQLINWVLRLLAAR